jgi:REP element-mobilizing transposase RayT
MSSYRQLLYHLVFRTRESRPVIDQDHAAELYAYISGIIKNKNSHLYRINGVEDHCKKTFEQEYRSLLMESGVKIDERYFP